MATRAEAWVAGLRELADFAEQHPELFDLYGETVNIFASTAEEMARKTRMIGTATKSSTNEWYVVSRMFGPHKLDLNISRRTFCERILVGTKIVVKPDPEALEKVPTIEVEEDVFEWLCPEAILSFNSTEEDS
jgi:hypothetical protein